MVEDAGQRVDRGVAARCQNLLHCIVPGISDEDVPACVQRNASGRTEAATQRVDRGIAACSQYLFHSIVAGICDKDVSAAVHRDAGGELKPVANVLTTTKPPAARISFIALSPVSATKTLPLLSSATPSGELNPLFCNVP